MGIGAASKGGVAANIAAGVMPSGKTGVALTALSSVEEVEVGEVDVVEIAELERATASSDGADWVQATGAIIIAATAHEPTAINIHREMSNDPSPLLDACSSTPKTFRYLMCESSTRKKRIYNSRRCPRACDRSLRSSLRRFCYPVDDRT
jgi:hypothetical protein